MTGYLQELLARQSLAAREDTAVETVMARLRQLDAQSLSRLPPSAAQEDAAQRETPVRAGIVARLLRRLRGGEPEAAPSAPAQPLPPAAEIAQGRQTAEETAWLPETLAAEGMVPALSEQLAQRLSLLAEESARRAADAAAWEDVPAAAGIPMQQMEQRLRRAMWQPEPLPPQARTLPADGPRSLRPGATAEAAALSRVYERDARRYDGCFEFPL